MLPAELRDAARLDGRGVLIVDEHLAARRALDERDQLQDAALAGAGMAGQERELARLDAERHARQAPRGRWGSACRPGRSGSCAPRPRSRAAPRRTPTALNTPKSSVSSPTPTKRMGMPSFCAMASTTPPLAVPSSLVTTRPVTPRPLWNSSPARPRSGRWCRRGPAALRAARPDRGARARA